MTELFVDVPGGRVWSRLIGDGPGTPLVGLHGGPGWPTPSLEPLTSLSDDRPVLLYDQLGCGRSDRPDDVSLWVLDRFIDELIAVLDAHELDRPFVMGHSWGTILAVATTLAHPNRIAGLVLTSPVLSMPRYTADVTALLGELPDDVEVDAEWNRRHFCRIEPHPEPMQRAGAGFGVQVYQTMNGASEYQPDGNLADLDLTGRLTELKVPTLFTCGRFDACTPNSTDWYASLVPNATAIVFEQSSHVAFFEEPDHYLAAVRTFLAGADAPSKGSRPQS